MTKNGRQKHTQRNAKSLSVFIRDMIAEGISAGKQGDEIRTELQATRRELSQIGNNINQIAKRVNGGEQNANINDELKEINKLRKQLAKTIATMRGRLK
ncbi:plasmid mobilization relaxosome protein MobC [Komagataeibacter rhaeticus]|nr:plasmid mobilization relaxosome protein MobC [Komagataeibacter rhaeticus]